MVFQVINEKGAVMMRTDYVSCIPKESELNALSKAGYKFRVDGKNVGIRKLKEWLKKVEKE